MIAARRVSGSGNQLRDHDIRSTKTTPFPCAQKNVAYLPTTARAVTSLARLLPAIEQKDDQERLRFHREPVRRSCGRRNRIVTRVFSVACGLRSYTSGWFEQVEVEHGTGMPRHRGTLSWTCAQRLGAGRWQLCMALVPARNGEAHEAVCVLASTYFGIHPSSSPPMGGFQLLAQWAPSCGYIASTHGHAAAPAPFWSGTSRLRPLAEMWAEVPHPPPLRR